jgi:hypothetical protein
LAWGAAASEKPLLDPDPGLKNVVSIGDTIMMNK